ncbi:VWA domain-containing protein [bacterium]|nr:VWA domain-containing protein [bacterium]
MNVRMFRPWASMIAMFLLASLAAAQIIILPPPPHPPRPPRPMPPEFRPMREFEMRELSVDSIVRDQVAQVRVTQVLYNPNPVQIEAQYLFPVPADSTIQDFVLMVDGREMPGKIHTREEARRIYESIVRRQKDPALLEYIGQGVVQTSVFPIPPNSERKLTMKYTQVLKAESGAVDFTYPFGTEKIANRRAERMAMHMRIESKDPIKNIYSPTHDVRIRRDGDRTAEVSWERSSSESRGDFKLIYTLAGDPVGATLLSWRPDAKDDGYFMLLASPSVEARQAKAIDKSVILVLDRSGSMSGTKIEQAQKALRFVLERLGPGDTFNILAYDDVVESFRPELQRNDQATRRAALDYVDNIRSGGSTNINGALTQAVEMIKDTKRPGYVIFLTDGLPTAGETNEMPIFENVRKANKAGARLFCFGVGNDVNTRLLDRLASQGGSSQFVAQSEDVEAPVSRLYTKLSSPVLAGLKIELAGSDVNRSYPRDLPDLFRGEQFVWVGRYRTSGPATIKLTGSTEGKESTFNFKGDLAAAGEGSRNDFIERVWAGRRIGFLIDQIDLHGKSQELVSELVDLSRRYGILTPYTSFLADEFAVAVYDPTNGTTSSGDVYRLKDGMMADRAGRELRQLSITEGEDAVAQRSFKGAMSSVGSGAGGSATFYAPPPAAAPSMARAMPVLAKKIEKANETIRQIGPKTFYLRGDRWIDSEVTEAEMNAATVIERFSDKYFEMVGKLRPGEARYLNFDKTLVVKLSGKVYRIDPEKQTQEQSEN